MSKATDEMAELVGTRLPVRATDHTETISATINSLARHNMPFWA